MSLENDLFSALKSLVGNRVAFVTFPQPSNGAPPTWPAIRCTVVDSVPVVDLCGDGDDDTAEIRVQIDCVATTFTAARSLRLQVMATMRSFSTPALLDLSRNDYDADTKTYREVLDYIIHGST